MRRDCQRQRYSTRIPLEYGGRAQHTSVDSYDHLKIAYPKQATIIRASPLFKAANREEPLVQIPRRRRRPIPID